MNAAAVIEAPVQVLIVDDSDDQGELLRLYFERAGCEVCLVETAEEAIEAYSVSTPDLAVIDLLLPKMDGWELTKRLRQDQPGCAIAISSVLDIADFPLTEAALPKPFTGAQVMQVLRDCVPQWHEL